MGSQASSRGQQRTRRALGAEGLSGRQRSRTGSSRRSQRLGAPEWEGGGVAEHPWGLAGRRVLSGRVLPGLLLLLLGSAGLTQLWT